jgi:hypothetical protein
VSSTIEFNQISIFITKPKIHFLLFLTPGSSGNCYILFIVTVLSGATLEISSYKKAAFSNSEMVIVVKIVGNV